MPESAPKVTAGHVYAALELRFQSPEWWVEREVTLRHRRLDLVAVQCWGQRRIVGVEVKVARSDWLAELARWEKHDEWASAVDQFFIAAPKGLVRPDELPRGWGLLELSGTTSLRLKVHAHGEAGAGALPREVTARFLLRAAREHAELRRRVDDAKARVRREVYAEVEARVRAEYAERAQAVDATTLDEAAKWRALVAAVGRERWWSERTIHEAVALLSSASSLTVVERARTDLAQLVTHVEQYRERLGEAAAVMKLASDVEARLRD